MKLKIVSLVFLFLTASIVLGQVNFRIKKLNANSLAAILPEEFWGFLRISFFLYHPIILYMKII